MGKYNALVSGSVALQLFERTLWKESDLDIFMETGENAEAFGDYIMEKEGYRYVKTTVNHGYMMPDIQEVETYTKRSKMDSADLKVQIIITRHIPVQAILTGFYSSVVVNFFTWNKAYAIFPLPTFIHHKGYLLKPLSNHFSALLDKYSRRGWRFQEAMWPEEVSSNQPMQKTRRVGDEFTWVIPFDISNVTWSKTPDLALEYVSFRLEDEDRAETTYHTIIAKPFVSDVLRHEYLLGDSSWMGFLGKRVDELARMELYKVKPEARPQGFQDTIGRVFAMYRYMGSFEKPDSWTYWDDQIPKWYQAWRHAETAKKRRLESSTDP